MRHSRGVLPRFVLLGNPENRRVTLFQSALEKAGLPLATVQSWLEYLDEEELSFDSKPALLRVDSFGENFEVYRRLLARAGARDSKRLVDRRGEVLRPALAHDGFRDVLRALKSEFTKNRSWLVLNEPDDIDELFDKRRTSRRYAAEGIPVPEFFDEVPDEPAAVLERCRSLGWDEAFVKLSSGSSASCLAHVAFSRRGVTVTTSLEWDEPRWFNNLKVRVLTKAPDVDRALGFILSQGAQVERGVPKAKVGEQFFDLRVLCIEHEPRFVVMRQSALPITNLHLGGSRGDVDALRKSVGAESWASAMETCRRVARLYRSLHVGIDLLFEPDLKSHRVVEANAFGDLLPNLLVDGKSVWDWQVEAALTRWRAVHGEAPR